MIFFKVNKIVMLSCQLHLSSISAFYLHPTWGTFGTKTKCLVDIDIVVIKDPLDGFFRCFEGLWRD